RLPEFPLRQLSHRRPLHASRGRGRADRQDLRQHPGQRGTRPAGARTQLPLARSALADRLREEWGQYGLDGARRALGACGRPRASPAPLRVGGGGGEESGNAHADTRRYGVTARCRLLPQSRRHHTGWCGDRAERRRCRQHRLRRGFRPPPSRHRFRRMYRALAVVLLVLAPVDVGAQGILRGTVRSTQGAPIHGAMVGVAGSALYTQTDISGRYRLAAVPAGEVRVRAAAIGYSPQATVVSLTGGDSTTADFTLEPSPLELTPLDVVSTKLPRFGDHPVTSVAQVSEQEIDRRAVNTIDEAVDKVPAIQFLNGQINIRGSTGYVQGLNSRVLLLVDGVPMNQGDRGGINWDLVPVDQIERVDILKGAGSSLYGSSALGGVVNLTTKDVRDGAHA